MQQRQATLADWIAVASGILGAFMAVLDIQITTSAIAEINGAIGATPSEGSWVTTSYLIAEIITIPMTGWLGTVFGLKRYLSVNSALFILFSIGCAMSDSLGEMIFFRAGQGLAAGALIPTAITIVNMRLPPHRQPVGFALFGLVATIAPSIGPTLGGWLTDVISWRFLFYLNIGPGLIAIALQLYALGNERGHVSDLKKGDWLGIVSMIIGLGSLTMVLEEGQRHEWFDSSMIVVAAIAAAIGIAVFLIAELTAEEPLLNLRLLFSRTVGASCLLMAMFGATVYGSIYVIPIYLAQIRGYSAQQIGEVIMWSGLPQLIIIPFIPWLMTKIDARLIVGTGLGLLGLSNFINLGLTHDSGLIEFMVPQILRAIGTPMGVIPLVQLSSVGLSARDTADASSLTNILRNVGGAVGISSLSTLVQVREQFHFSAIAERITANSLSLQERLIGLEGLFAGDGGMDDAPQQAVALLARQVRVEALVMTYSDAFWLLGIVITLSMVTPLFMKKPDPNQVGGPAH